MIRDLVFVSVRRGRVVVCASLDRHALGQIARLVDIAAAPARDMIGQQLERHDGQERLHDLGRIGHRQEDIGQMRREPGLPRFRR